MTKNVSASLSQRLVARYFAGLLAVSGVVSALVHPLPNLTDMSATDRSAITLTCVVGGMLIWFAPWQRWPRWSLYALPVIGLGVKMWANLLGGLGPYSYSIHFVLVYIWMGIALPRGAPLAFAPLLVIAYAVPLALQGDPRQVASVAMVAPICVVIGESVAWISNRLREVEGIDGQRMLRMAWLVEASGQLAHRDERRALARSIARLATQLPSALGSAVVLPGARRGLDLTAESGWPGNLPERFELADEPALVHVMRSGESLSFDDPRCAELSLRLGVPRLAVAALPGSAACAGIVLLARRSGAARLDDFNQHLVRTLTMQAGLAIERVLLSETLRTASLHDELTGIGNRRKAGERLGRLQPGDALVLIDLDHFKQVNDTHGHAAGDEALRDLGRFMESTLRTGDEVFRMGGEEFLVVLEGPGRHAVEAAERFCQGWRHREPVTTFSAGVAVHGEGESSEATLARADAALYQAKDAGRDRVACAPGDADPKPA